MVSVTNQLKLLAPDGKRRLTDVLDAEGVAMLAKSIMPNQKAAAFLDWLIKSDNTIDGQINKNDYLEAMTQNVVDATRIKSLISAALTDDISSREMFMKGIDYSYYYEEK